MCLSELLHRLSITEYEQARAINSNNLSIPIRFDFDNYLADISLIFEDNMAVHNVYEVAADNNRNRLELLINSEIELFTWRLLDPNAINGQYKQLSPILVSNMLNAHDLITLKDRIFQFVSQFEMKVFNKYIVLYC
jgi:hypothetical protein